MKNKSLTLTVMAIIALMIGMVPLNVNAKPFPRMDDLYSVICSDEPTMMTKARGGMIDNLMDIRDPANVEELEGLGWSISASPAYSIHISNVNCRDYCPETAGYYVSYHDRVPGTPLYPLNLTYFRFALHVLIAGSKMQEWCSEIFDWTQIPLHTVITPSHGYWYNTEITVYDYDPGYAYDLLTGHGWSNSTGHWIMPNGQELRHIYVLCCIEAEHSTSAISMREAASWNQFFGKHSDDTDYFVDESIAFTFNDMIDITFYQRDFDISSHGWSLGMNPDYVYDFFHPDVDVPWGDNACGFSDPEINDKEYAVKFWRWPNGTPVVTLQDMIDLVWDLQEDLYYAQPFLVTYCSVYVNAFAPTVQGWADSLGYGSDISQTYNWVNWQNPLKKDIRMCVSSDINTLNIGWASTVYDYQVLNRIFDGLWDIEPFDHIDLNWVSDSYTTEPWADALKNVTYGQKVTFHIRPGIYWQDGNQFTASDVKFAYDFIANLSLAQYATIATTYIESIITDPMTVEVYMNCTGLWYLYDYAGAGALFPPVIWTQWLGNAAGAEAFQPWATNYDTYTSSSGHGSLTCLIGTGAWIFIEWSEITDTCYSVANRPNAVWTGNPGYWAVALPVREDINTDLVVDVSDIAATIAAFGATPGHPRWDHGRCDVSFDTKVDISDIAMVIAGFGQTNPV